MTEPRVILAKNLAAAIKAKSLSGPQLAVKAGVDRKTVNNWLNERFSGRSDLLDAVARALGCTASDLLSPDYHPTSTKGRGQVKALIQYYEAADDTGRENIMRIAEMAGTPPKGRPST